MTQDVADKDMQVNVKHVRQVSDLLQRALAGSLSDEQMQAIALAVGSGQNPSTTALAHMIKIAYARNPGMVKQFLSEQVAFYESTVLLFTCRLHSLILSPTKGVVTIASATDVFTGYIDPNFANWGSNQDSADTKEVVVDVHEMSRDGNSKQLFGSLGVSDPRRLCLTEGQIVEFCRTHRDHLRQDGYGTFFLYEGKDRELFVAVVGVRDGKLKALVLRFGRGDVWRAGGRLRLVVKQQTA